MSSTIVLLIIGMLAGAWVLPKILPRVANMF